MERLGQQGAEQIKFGEARLRGLKPVMEGNLNAVYSGEEKSFELREKFFRLNQQSMDDVYCFPRTIYQPPNKRALQPSVKPPRINIQALSSVTLLR